MCSTNQQTRALNPMQEEQCAEINLPGRNTPMFYGGEQEPENEGTSCIEIGQRTRNEGLEGKKYKKYIIFFQNLKIIQILNFYFFYKIYNKVCVVF